MLVSLIPSIVLYTSLHCGIEWSSNDIEWYLVGMETGLFS